MPVDVPAWHHPLCIGCHSRHAKDTPCADGRVWWSLQLECSICTRRWVGVCSTAPGKTEIHPECPGCAHIGYVKVNPETGTANGTQLETEE